MSQLKSTDLIGWDVLWLCKDLENNLAVCTTSGNAHIPDGYLVDWTEIDVLTNDLDYLPKDKGCFRPTKEEVEEFYGNMQFSEVDDALAEQGLFVYYFSYETTKDLDIYIKIASPMKLINIIDLSDPAQKILARATYEGRFAEDMYFDVKKVKLI